MKNPKSVAVGCFVLGAITLIIGFLSGPSLEGDGHHQMQPVSGPSKVPQQDRKSMAEQWAKLQELSPELQAAEERVRQVLECEVGFAELCASIALMISDQSILPANKVQEMIDSTDRALIRNAEANIALLQAALENQPDADPAIRIAMTKKHVFIDLRKGEKEGEVTAGVERDSR